MTFDWIALIRDFLVIAYMVILRIGVPLVVTLLGGAWLRKVLEPKPDAAHVATPRQASQSATETPRL